MTEDKAKQTPAGGVLVGKREGQTIIHDKGTQGGYFVGRLHKEGGIKGINKSTGQPIEVQGGEVIITAPAVADQTKREFEGEMLTNREILSKINQKGGGVSLENGGEIYYTGSSYNYGGKTMTDYEIMKAMNGCGCEDEYEDGGEVEKALNDLEKAPSVNFWNEPEFQGESYFFNKEGEPNSFVSLQEDDISKTILAYDEDGQLVGVFRIRTAGDLKGAFKIVVREDAMRKGWGKKILDEAEKQNIDIVGNIKNNSFSSRGRDLLRSWLKSKNKFDNGGQLNLMNESKKGDHPARDLNNYNDLMDVEADGMVGAESGLFAYGGRVSNSKLFMPSVRGGWTKEKIIKYQKSHSSDTTSTLTLLKYISEFSDWEQFKNHIYYHGTQSSIEKGLKPSITMSEREVERIGGGGYGQRYFGVSLTKRKRTAESFSGMSNGVIIYPVILKRDAKVIERTDLQDASEIEDIIVELYEKGVDAVYIGGGEEELVVVNPYSILLYKIGREYHSVFGGFKSVPLTDEKIKEIYTNSKILSETYTEEYNSKQNKEEREQFLKSIPEIKFDDGGEVGADFTFLKSNPMQRARAINVLEKVIRYDNKFMSNYEFLEGLPKDLEVGVSKLHSRKTERGYVEKLSIGDFIVDAKAEIDYYKYLQENGYPYSKYIKEVREAEAKKNEADKIIRDKQNEIKKLQNIENYKNSEISKKNQIKELIENGANAMIKKMNAPRLIQIEKYKTQRQTNDVKNEIDYHTRMIEQTERQVNSAYKIASKLYEIVDGEVQPKFDWKVGDKVKVEGYLNHAPAEIETEIVEIRVDDEFGFTNYKVEKKEGIANNYISYDGLFPTPRNESRKKLIEELEKEKQGKKEYEYVLTVRPFDIGTYPKDNFLRFEQQDYQYGVVIYSEPISIREIEHYSLCPITEIKDFDDKFLYYIFSDTKQKIRIKLIKDQRKGYFVNIIYYDDEGIESTEMMSAVNFLKKVKDGDYKLENEITEEPMNDIEITTGYFKVNSENTGFEYAKKINNYFNKWNKIKTLKDKLDFERLNVPMFGSFENESVLDQIERFEKLGFELGANEVVRNDFKKEVKKIIDKKIFDREMDKKGYPKEDEEVNKKENSFEGEGSKEGKGKLYEFFTPQMVADKMLALAQHYGFKGGNVLEPASGNGRLLKHLKDSNITAFEISKENFEILKKEFPNADLHNFNFEKAFLKEPRFNTLINKKGTETWLKTPKFDLVLANPPYGKFSGLYSSYFNFKGQVEHFFILQTLHLLKKGGLGVYLIPSSFLRNGITYNKVKQEIFEIAELVDAYRLPSNIFEKTQIGTDILILRKK